MAHYVDAEKLTAKIERYENTAIDAYNPHGEDADFWHGKVVACEDLKTLIDSLQQEQPQVADASKMDEVDLEKAFAHEYAIYHLPNFIIASIADGTELIDLIYKTARHFAEWGAEHARKEK